MKKLLILLFSILISFNSYGGSVDGKGLKCEQYHGPYRGGTIYMWFEDGYSEIPIIEGTIITWKRYRYNEWGTKNIRFDIVGIYKLGYPFTYLSDAQVDREHLILKPIRDSWEKTKYRCSIQYYKQWIISDLQEIINDSNNANQI